MLVGGDLSVVIYTFGSGQSELRFQSLHPGILGSGDIYRWVIADKNAILGGYSQSLDL